jgi:hypothetical protein
MISGTVSDYNNETLQLLETRFGEYGRLLHNAHDGDKYAIKVYYWNDQTVEVLISTTKAAHW